MASLLLRTTRAQASAAIASAAASVLIVASTVSTAEDCDETNHQSSHLLYFRPKLVCQCESALLRREHTMRIMDLATQKSRSFASCYYINKKDPPLGEGGFGAVHLAKDRVTGEKFAVKRIPKSMTDVESFQREMNALLRIRSSGGHPHICALRDSFDEGPDYLLVLDYISGGEMFDHLIRNGAYSEADAARLVREVASALAFLHGIGVVHADLKPENIMLSTAKATDAVVKLVDFGSSVSLWEEDDDDGALMTGGAKVDGDGVGDENRTVGLTAAYSPPEALLNPQRTIKPSTDMFSLGVILYIMLTGRHPFDLDGDGTDDDIAERILDGEYPLRDSDITKHMSESAITLIEQLMDSNPKTRLTADAMLEHPWVRGETATTDIIKGSDKRLGRFRVFKSKLQAKFFQDVVEWSDDTEDETKRKTSLIERSFRSFDEKGQGFLTPEDLGEKVAGVNTDESGGESLSMSAFDNLLSENMKHKYFPKGHVIYNEGDIGNHMYFINSGSIVVSTSDGSRAVRSAGDFFGEGALLHPKKIRSATISCKTPVHAMEISREYFDKYLATSESGLMITLREKDKIRKRNRAKTILRLQNNLKERRYKKGESLFDVGEDGDSVFLVEKGKVDVVVGGEVVFSATPGNICGENSLLTGRRRNCSAVCASKEGCVAEQMMGRDFRKLMDLSPEMNLSLRDLSLRRDFKKAVVCRLKKQFPYSNPREAFNAVKKADNKGDELSVEEIGDLLREMDPDYTDEEIMEVINTMNLTKSGKVSFDEFKKVFIANIKTSASM